MVDCSNVYVSVSNFSSENNQFMGAFSKKKIMNGELVEMGIMRRLSNNENKAFNGMKNPFVFTWSDDIPNHTWAIASGCATFYNSGLKTDTNTKMIRHFDTDTFKIIATKDIHVAPVRSWWWLWCFPFQWQHRHRNMGIE